MSWGVCLCPVCVTEDLRTFIAQHVFVSIFNACDR